MKLEFTEKDCLEAAVSEVIGIDDLKKKLATGQKLRIKLGIDPTSPDIHLGRSIPLWRLRAFQELGHEIHFIIGDFTGQVGDTSDKESERPMLSEAKIRTNLTHYLDQCWMILSPEKKEQVHIHYNSEWLQPLSFAHFSQLADAFSVNSFIKRELIARRLEAGSRVSLREMLYPVMQGYDSVMIKADVEIGGTDQRFNLLAGRILQEQAGQPPQAIILNSLIRGLDGRKMSSSWGNIISLLDTPGDKFGKVMRMHDELMTEFLLVMPSSVQPFSQSELAERLAHGENPRDLKLQLASRLVALYHGEEVALKEKEQFIAQFSEHQQPTEIEKKSYKHLGEKVAVVELLCDTGLVPSKSEGRRLIEQGGVRINSQPIQDGAAEVVPQLDMVIQIGKRRFIQLTA